MRECPACQSSAASSVGHKAGFDLVRCAGCRTVFTTEVPADNHSIYEKLHEESTLDDIPDIVRVRTAEIVATFDPWRGKGRLLDVGCGVGHVLEAAVAAGWRPEGVEVVESAVRNLTGRGFTVRRGFLDEMNYAPELFDVVVASEVIEHVHDPGTFVAECRRVLRPGGLFYVTTPNGAGGSARMLGTRWSTIAPPDHLQLFTNRGIRTLFERHSLTTRRIATEGFNPYEVISRVRGTGDNFDRVGSARALNASFSATRGRRLVKSVINHALTATRMGDGIKVYAERSEPDKSKCSSQIG
jgi:SAM-dependent methyltransferase